MINLEHLADGSVSDRNFQALMNLVLDTGGKSIGLRFGTKSFLWPGGTAQQTFTIDHGLGRAPQVVLAVNSNNNTAAMPRTYTYTATQFELNLIAPANVAATTGDTFHWVAIG